MKENIKIVLLYTVPMLLYFSSSYFLTEDYYEFSLQRLELCLKQTSENNLPLNICTHITSSSNLAFSQAVSIYSPTIILLFIIVIALGHKILRMDTELKGLKEKTDV